MTPSKLWVLVLVLAACGRSLPFEPGMLGAAPAPAAATGEGCEPGEKVEHYFLHDGNPSNSSCEVNVLMTISAKGARRCVTLRQQLSAASTCDLIVDSKLYRFEVSVVPGTECAGDVSGSGTGPWVHGDAILDVSFGGGFCDDGPRTGKVTLRSNGGRHWEQQLTGYRGNPEN